MLDSRPRGFGLEPHQRHCFVSLSKKVNGSLVLVQPRKTCSFINERLLMGCKESNQTNKQINKSYNKCILILIFFSQLQGRRPRSAHFHLFVCPLTTHRLSCKCNSFTFRQFLKKTDVLLKVCRSLIFTMLFAHLTFPICTQYLSQWVSCE